MGFIADPWLQILLSSVFVFVASSVIHMALGYHMAALAPQPKMLRDTTGGSSLTTN